VELKFCDLLSGVSLLSFLQERIVHVLCCLLFGPFKDRNYYIRDEGCIFRRGNVKLNSLVSMVSDPSEIKEAYKLGSHLKDLLMQYPGGLLGGIDVQKLNKLNGKDKLT
jgi:hypothetical protein